MSESTIQPLPDAIKQALMHGDLSELTAEQQLLLYHQTCASLGLNPLTNPFSYLWLKGDGDKKRLVLYATKGCADQLRNIHGITAKIVDRVVEDGLCIVTARSSDASGRYDEDFGIVPIAKEVGTWKKTENGKSYFQGEGIFTPFEGEARASAIKKALTQAKRRSTLSFCGLGMLDESEIASIPDAVAVTQEPMGTPQPSVHSRAALGPSDAVAMPSTMPVYTPEPVMSTHQQPRASVTTPPMTGQRESSNQKSLPKPSAEEVLQLLEFMQSVYGDSSEVDAKIRAALHIPSGQVWSPYRIRTTMTGEQYNSLEDDAKSYAQANVENDQNADEAPLGDEAEAHLRSIQSEAMVTPEQTAQEPPESTIVTTSEPMVAPDAEVITTTPTDIQEGHAEGDDGMEFRPLDTDAKGHVTSDAMNDLHRWADEHGQQALLKAMFLETPLMVPGRYRYCWVQIAKKAGVQVS